MGWCRFSWHFRYVEDCESSEKSAYCQEMEINGTNSSQ